MRLRFLYPPLALLAVMLSPRVTAAQASSACRPADAKTPRMILWLTNVVTRTDPAAIAQRDNLGLPQMTGAQITLVTEKSVCSKVLNVYKANVANSNAATGTPVPSSGKLYVFKIGTLYVATDPAQDVGEFSIWLTVDGRYNLLGSGMG